MLYHAKNGTIPVGNSDMDYISFGTGNKALVMLPGLGDGLSTVKGKAIPFALAYRMYAKNYKIYLFSRKNNLQEGYTTRKMAKDQAEAMKALGITKAHIVGISQGGMIAQYLAIDYPDLVDRLILAVTASGANETLKEVVEAWIQMAKQENYKAFMIDTAEKSYTAAYLKKYRLFYPLLVRVGRPKNPERFLIQASSCLSHDAHTELSKIKHPTLVIGGGCDRIVGPDSAPALAGQITGSQLWIYEELGHAAYEEARDFHNRVLDFCDKKS